jgi:hypothetical protein
MYTISTTQTMIPQHTTTPDPYKSPPLSDLRCSEHHLSSTQLEAPSSADLAFENLNEALFDELVVTLVDVRITFLDLEDSLLLSLQLLQQSHSQGTYQATHSESCCEDDDISTIADSIKLTKKRLNS